MSQKLGNTKLVEYGIQNEKSDLRVHVCAKIGRVYYYPTASGQVQIKEKEYRKVPARTRGIVTAEGYLVPPQDIQGCKGGTIPLFLLEESGIQLLPEKGRQHEKGEAAVFITKNLLKSGDIKIPHIVKEITDLDMQVSGTDIFVKTEIKIQVKCDFKGGPKAHGGTGNLFLQVSECNPYKIY